MYTALVDAKDSILRANAADLEAASRAAQNGELSQSLVKRLDLHRKAKFDDMLKGVLDVRQLDDPGTCCLKQSKPRDHLGFLEFCTVKGRRH